MPVIPSVIIMTPGSPNAAPISITSIPNSPPKTLNEFILHPIMNIENNRAITPMRAYTMLQKESFLISSYRLCFDISYNDIARKIIPSHDNKPPNNIHTEIVQISNGDK